MSANAKKGGYLNVNFGTTTGLTTSTPILGLLNGTTIGEGEGLNVDDAAGRPLSVGLRMPAIIRTSAITSAPIASLITHKNACTDLYFRFYGPGGARIHMGPVRVANVRYAGSEVGNFHQYIIEITAFEEDSTDIITVEA